MSMARISLKIAYPIIIAGLFIIVSFVAVNYQTLNGTFYFVLGLLIVYIFLFGFATGQNFSSPIKKLLKSAESVSRGDLKSRSYLETKDELGQLSKTFNRVADALEQSHIENERMEKSVDIKVKARTQHLEETINALEQKVKNRTLELQRIAEELQSIKQQPGVKPQVPAAPKPAKKPVKKAAASAFGRTESASGETKSAESSEPKEVKPEGASGVEIEDKKDMIV